MKIAIIGTRGIPNNYGGFEQLAEYLSVGLIQKGHQVWVYSSHTHAYQQANWNGVNIIHQHDPEAKVGTIGQFIYDLNCILDSRKRHFDVILNLGYTSSAIWMKFFPKKTKLITNMDGLEWKRSKYSGKVRTFLKYSESWAVKGSDVLVADSLAIQTYLKNKYQKDSAYIAYGAHLFTEPDPEILKQYALKPYHYFLLIARMEPENNIEMILDGFVSSDSSLSFFVIGNTQNKFGTYLKQKFTDKRIVFVGPLYDMKIINNLRYYSCLYFHGHSVGGTNPSLLEAMASNALIAAHENEFNKSILTQNAFYFKSNDEVSGLINHVERIEDKRAEFVERNLNRIKNDFSWNKIIQQYENVIIGNG